ncbi:MAG: ABC transporter ATP-binding protein [Verrucomicrobiaceae bacterium]
MSKTIKVSRKDLANLSTTETMKLAREVYSKLFTYMRPYRWRFYLGIFFEILSGLSNAVMIYGFKIVFSVVLPVKEGDAQNMGVIKLLGHKVDVMQWIPADWRGGMASVIVACVLVPVLFLLRGGLTYIANYLMMWVGNRILYDLRNDTYKSLMSQSIGYYSSAKVGQLVQTVFNQSRVAQQNLVTLSQDIVQRPVAIISILVALLSQNWHFTVYSLIVFPLCILPVVAIGNKVRKSGTQEELEAGQMMVLMNEAFGGIRVVKSYAREDYELERFNKSNAKTNKLTMRYGKALELVGMLVETVASFGVGIGLFYAWKTGINANDFMVLVGGLTQIYPHAKALSRMQLLIQKTIVATSTVFSVMEEIPEVADGKDATVLPRVNGRIRLNDVGFTYKTSKKNQRAAVQHVTLDLQPGKFYALVGPSGAGKSTLFALLQRFYDVDEGGIEVDGLDIRKVTQKSLRENLGVVSQDIFLFHDTIHQNILYGRLGAKKDEVIEAAKKAHAHDFIKEQEHKYDTVIGDRGDKLSGGQKQRISIARAILRNAPILLLDEATSALDTESEKIIQDAIHTLSEGKTVMAIAHRLSTILQADQIVVMDKGAVLDTGTHSELLGRCELYQRLYQLQFHGGAVDPDHAVDDVKIDEQVEVHDPRPPEQ